VATQAPVTASNGAGELAVAIPALPPAPRHPVRLTPVILVVVQMLLDVFAITAAFALSYYLRFPEDIELRNFDPEVQTYLGMFGVTVGTMLLTFHFSRLYNLKRGASRVDEFYKIAAAISIGTVLSLATNSVLLGADFIYSRQVLLIGWFLAIFFVTVLRLLYSVAVGEMRKHGLDRARVLVVGAGPTAAVVVDRLDRHRTIGYEVVGVVENTRDGRQFGANVGRAPVLGSINRLPQIVRKHKVDEVIVALSGASDQQLREIIELIQDESVSVKIYPDAFQLMTQNEVSVAELSGLPLLTVKDVALRGWNRKVKRAFDVLFSATVLIITAPLLMVIAVLVKLSSPGPVFFIQTRVGLDGTPFQLVKFRTMRVLDNDGANGKAAWTVENDPRRTSIGSFLRRFSLDELPQFYNVLIGEMSVVGPRPEQPEYVKEFAAQIPQYLRRHREKAGITGWAQVNGLRGDSSIELRTKADLYYVENWSLLFDLKIIVRTLLAMVRGKNAY
jgi:Undecaprenyl-phosphate glucose phosphotransferase